MLNYSYILSINDIMKDDKERKGVRHLFWVLGRKKIGVESVSCKSPYGGDRIGKRHSDFDCG